MDENNQEMNNKKSGSEYTGEYGNPVEGSPKTDTTYSYSYKSGDNSATHSGDYYGGNTSHNNSFKAGDNSYTDSSNNSTNDNGSYTNAGSSTYSTNDNGYTNADDSYSNYSNNGYRTGYNQNGYNANGYNNNYRQNQSGHSNGNVPKKSGDFGKKLLICAACAVVFGLIAGVCFEGVRYVSRNVIGINSESDDNNGAVQASKTAEKVSGVSTSGAVVVAGAVTDVSGIVEQAMPSVVAITSTTVVTNYYSLFGQSQEQEATSAGTGFIIGQNNKELLIATNNHVIDGAKTISVQFIDDEIYEASTKGTDSSNDLAVIAVKLSDIKDATMNQIKIADLGDSDDVKVGEMAIAIGNSLGYGQSVTVGYISAKDREINETSETDGSTNTIEAIQTDAAINPGNSGGPLMNLHGQVIGINSAKIADSSVEGVGYAIPISVANPIMDDLKTKENLSDDEKGYLGISGRTVSDEATAYNLPTGVYVAEVSEGGAADKAGIKVGDIITSVNNMSVTTIESLQEKVNSYRKGTKVDITLKRSNNGAYDDVTVTVKLQGAGSLDGLSSGSTGDDSSSDSENNNNNNNNNNNDGWGSFFSNPFGY